MYIYLKTIITLNLISFAIGDAYIGLGLSIFVFILSLKFFKIRYSALFIISLFFIFTILKFLTYNSAFIQLQVLRFNFSILFYWLFFHNFRGESNFNKSIKLIILYLVIFNFVEAILINIIPNFSLLPGIDKQALSNAGLLYGNRYKRAYGLGWNPGVTSTILVSLLYYYIHYIKKLKSIKSILKNRYFLYTIIAILLNQSGTGILILILAVLITLIIFKKYKTIIIFSLILLFIFFLPDINEDTPILFRLNINYYSFLFNLKVDQFVNSYNWAELSNLEMLMGADLKPGQSAGIGNDTGWVPIIFMSGIVGLIIYLLFIIVNFNFKNKIPIILILISSFHYGTAWYPLGALVLALFLNIDSKEISIYKDIIVKNKNNK